MRSSNNFNIKEDLIVVNKVLEYNRVVAYTVFSVSTGTFKEVKTINNSYRLDDELLPSLDGFSFNLNTNGLIVLGFIETEGVKKYVVCDGGRLIYYYSYDRLIQFNLLNVIISELNEIFFKNRTLINLNFLFEKDTVEFIDIPKYSSTGSSGQNVKLIGVHKLSGSYGLVKFPLTSRSLDCKNEVVCKNLANLFKVPCCEAVEVKYMGREGVLSIYNYDKTSGFSPVSLRQLLVREKGSGYMDLNLLVNKFGKQFEEDYFRSVVFDVLTLQEDRHESNLSIYDGKLYPLYDNGRSLLNGNAGQRFENNYSLVKRLGPSKVKELICCDVSYEDIYNSIDKVYGKSLLNLSREIADRAYDLLVDITREVY